MIIKNQVFTEDPLKIRIKRLKGKKISTGLLISEMEIDNIFVADISQLKAVLINASRNKYFDFTSITNKTILVKDFFTINGRLINNLDQFLCEFHIIVENYMERNKRMDTRIISIILKLYDIIENFKED